MVNAIIERWASTVMGLISYYNFDKKLGVLTFRNCASGIRNLESDLGRTRSTVRWEAVCDGDVLRDHVLPLVLTAEGPTGAGAAGFVNKLCFLSQHSHPEKE